MKAKIFIYLTWLFFVASGCENFLEEVPRDIIAPENYFQSESDFRASITGLYAIYKNNAMYGQLGLDAYYDNGVDILEPNRAAVFLNSWCNYIINESSVQEIAQLMGAMQTWKDCYRVINNANVILGNLEGKEDILLGSADEIRGEILFLRSLAYYHLTNMWGNVPYFRQFTSLEEISRTGREDVNKIRNEILIDLQQAQDWMPLTVPASQNGRATSWAAAILMVKIYLIQNEWQKALDKSLEIINEGNFNLLENYDEVFSPDNEYNEEIIWSLDFAKDIQSMLEKGVPHLAGNGYWRPSMFVPRLVDEPKFSADRPSLINKLSENGHAFNGTGLQVCLPDFENKFPENDLRRSLNVRKFYEGIELNFAYNAKNWNLDVATSPRFNHGDNRIIFRLADVYLMAAEAENELNGPANAYQYINKVRERAYATQEEWELKDLTQVEFRQTLFDERKWELAGECHRKMDLIRWGLLLDVVNTTEYRAYDPAANIQPHMVLLPIGELELQLNPTLLESDPTNNGYR